ICLRSNMAKKAHLANLSLVVLSVVVLNSALVQRVNAASPPKPPDLYQGYTITLLRDGKWLVAGGQTANGNLDNADKATLFDPPTGTWTNTGNMTTQRLWHAATLLSDGKVLVSGGQVRTNL